MELLGIYYVVIICSNYEKLKYFYSEVLKLLIIYELYCVECDLYKLDLVFFDGS